MGRLEKLLKDKEICIQDMERHKEEMERKFEVELDMLKNQHEVEVLSLQQRLEETHRENIRELETSVENEKIVSSRLRGELAKVKDNGNTKDIDTLKEELMSTRSRYESEINQLKQELKKEKDDEHNELVTNEHAGDIAVTANKVDDELRLTFEREIENIKEMHREELETLKYVLQEKEIQIIDLTRHVNDNVGRSAEVNPSTHEGGKLFSGQEVSLMLDELRERLTKESEQNIAMANDLWRRKFEERQSKGNFS